MLTDVLGKLGFDWKVALANLVNFLLIFWLLRNVVFRKLGAAIRERREKIQAGLDDAEKAKTELMMAGHEKERIITNGHQEAKNLVLTAEARGEEIVEAARVEAEAVAHTEKEKALRELETLREHQSREIREKSVDLVIAGVQSILKKKIDAKEAENMIKSLAK